MMRKVNDLFFTHYFEEYYAESMPNTGIFGSERLVQGSDCVVFFVLKNNGLLSSLQCGIIFPLMGKNIP